MRIFFFDEIFNNDIKKIYWEKKEASKFKINKINKLVQDGEGQIWNFVF